MKKYLTLFGLSWQKQLEVRSDFLFERSRSISLLFALYFLWSAIFAAQSSLRLRLLPHRRRLSTLTQKRRDARFHRFERVPIVMALLVITSSMVIRPGACGTTGACW